MYEVEAGLDPVKPHARVEVYESPIVVAKSIYKITTAHVKASCTRASRTTLQGFVYAMVSCNRAPTSVQSTIDTKGGLSRAHAKLTINRTPCKSLWYTSGSDTSRSERHPLPREQRPILQV